MAQQRRFEQQQKELEKLRMKKLPKTESEQAEERLEIIEGLMDQCEELAQQPLSWYEMSQLGLAHDHLFKVAKKLTFDYNLESAKVPQGETE
jgi:hypothetical protein|tara:strand:- start:16 stop:291 length:276 start_codon:yes stop_codon:yes gene_type:complete